MKQMNEDEREKKGDEGEREGDKSYRPFNQSLNVAERSVLVMVSSSVGGFSLILILAFE